MSGILEDSPKKIKKSLAKPMGILRPNLEEEGFDKRLPDVYPLRSPITSLAGHPEETKAPPPASFKPSYSGKFMSALMKVRSQLNKVYSDGYFENHYPEADKELKKYLHEETMATWSKAREDDGTTPEAEEKHGGEEQQITIVVNLNK